MNTYPQWEDEDFYEEYFYLDEEEDFYNEKCFDRDEYFFGDFAESFEDYPSPASEDQELKRIQNNVLGGERLFSLSPYFLCLLEIDFFYI